MLKSNRRNFIKTGAVAGIGIPVTGINSPDSGTARAAVQHEIKYRSLGSTGYNVSEIGFGAMNMRDPELVHAAIDAGINYIDTAHKYMNGVNEQVVGKVMQTKRDKVFLTTKLKSTDPEKMPQMLETSLKRLKTDHVDLVLLHNVDDVQHFSRNDLMKIFEEFKRKGQTRFVGISSHRFPAEYADALIELDFWEAILVSYNYVSNKEVTESIHRVREAGIGVIGMKNLLRVKEKDAKPLLNESDGVTLQQALLRWVLDNKNVDTVIPGMTSFDHLAEDLPVMTMKLGFQDRKLLRKYAEVLRGQYCFGLAGCTGCLEKCPNGVTVHELNRCLNYAEGYGNRQLAYENYSDLPHSSRIDICDNCDECTVHCVNGLNLSEQIGRARRLFA